MKLKLHLIMSNLFSTHNLKNVSLRWLWFWLLLPFFISILIGCFCENDVLHLPSSWSSTSLLVGILNKWNFSRFFFIPAHLQLSKTWNAEIVANVSVIHFPSNINDKINVLTSTSPNTRSDRSRKTFIVYSDPAGACTRNIAKPPSADFVQVSPHSSTKSKSRWKKRGSESSTEDTSVVPNWILLCDDSLCETIQKIRNAQLAGYSGIIIHTSSDRINSIERSREQYLEDMKFYINVSFVSNSDGHLVKERFAYPKRYKAKLVPDWNLISSLRTKVVNAVNIGAWNRSIRKAVVFQDCPKLIAYIILILMIFSPVILLRVCPTRDSNQRYHHFEFSPSWSWHRHEFHRERNSSEVNESSSKELRCRELLGVSLTADREAINEAFRQNIRNCHPDKSDDKSLAVLEELTKKSQELIEARDFLLTRS